MLQGLISSILVQEPDIVVAGNVAGEEPLGPAIDTAAADVVIICEQAPEAAPNYNQTLLSHPRIRLLLITEAGRDSYLYVLAPTLRRIPELSVATLLAVLREGRDWQVASGSGGWN
jgi:hypothetical protein